MQYGGHGRIQKMKFQFGKEIQLSNPVLHQSLHLKVCLLMLILALGILGCNSTGKSEGDACQGVESRCTGMVLEQCQNQVWVEVTDCTTLQMVCVSNQNIAACQIRSVEDSASNSTDSTSIETDSQVGDTSSDSSTSTEHDTSTDPDDTSSEYPDDTSSEYSSCGDGVVDAVEVCDDGNQKDGDGCHSNCQVMTDGYQCPLGKECYKPAMCGDGFVHAAEMCDDGNNDDSDGCTANCVFEVGYSCTDAPSHCNRTTCGNSNVEPGESCDDGNQIPFDGCSALCQLEPGCDLMVCPTNCGDGLVDVDEECDDGNVFSGDGCSAHCTFELGYSCDPEVSENDVPQPLKIDVAYRDFLATDSDFDPSCGVGLELNVQDVVGMQLVNGKPVLADNWTAACISSEDSFHQWYHREPSLITQLVLYPNKNGGYSNRYGVNGEQWRREGTPVLSKCGDGPHEVIDCSHLEDADCAQACPDKVAANPTYSCESPCPDEYSNRTCLAAPFSTTCADCPHFAAGVSEYECISPCILGSNLSSDIDAGDVCEFGPLMEYFNGTPLFFPIDGIVTGTDWAKVPEGYGVNGYPWEVDVLGQTIGHNFLFTSEMVFWFVYQSSQTASVHFVGDDDVWIFANNQRVVDLGGKHPPLEAEFAIDSVNNYGMQEGGIYSIRIFHAERGFEVSSFALTLTGFSMPSQSCKAICGDGLVAAGEECDDGVNDGGYAECAPGCILGPHCGDSITQDEYGEKCDDGNFVSGDDCPSSCRLLYK